MSSKTNLLSINFYGESTTQQIENEFNKIVDFFKTNKEATADQNLRVWEHATYIELDEEHMNCERCSSCNSWVTDVDGPEPVLHLKKGTFVDEMFLCYDCLKEYLKKPN